MKLWLLLGILIIFTESYSQQPRFSHALYDSLLIKHVRDNRVNYRGIKENPALLKNYLHQIEKVDAGEFAKWSREEKIAFWINAYNAITIWGIVENYPVEYGNLISRLRFPRSSIRQVSGFWDTVFIHPMGKEITLNEIEHDILRKNFGEPRIHFALVCASLGCPPLRIEAYYPEQLERQLEEDTYNFIRNPKYVRLSRQEKVLYISSIFDWYAEDFGNSKEEAKEFSAYDTKYHGIVEFITRYLPATDSVFVVQNKLSIEFLDYDWTLNDLQ